MYGSCIIYHSLTTPRWFPDATRNSNYVLQRCSSCRKSGNQRGNTRSANEERPHGQSNRDGGREEHWSRFQANEDWGPESFAARSGKSAYAPFHKMWSRISWASKYNLTQVFDSGARPLKENTKRHCPEPRPCTKRYKNTAHLPNAPAQHCMPTG